MKRPSILISNDRVSGNTSAGTAMWATHALQDNYQVTIVTNDDFSIQSLNSSFGCAVDPALVKVIKTQPSSLPVNSQTLNQISFHRFCNRISVDYDLCISAYNFTPFQGKVIHLIADLGFSERLQLRLHASNGYQTPQKFGLLCSLYRKVRDLLSVNQGQLYTPGDTVVANSLWTAGQLENHFDIPDCKVIYPPVQLPIQAQKDEEGHRSSDRFLYLGPVTPEQELVKIITILDQVRDRGFDIELDLVGNLNQSRYQMMITEMSEVRPWINDLGNICHAQKATILARSGYGIHACKIDAFSFPTAEMAAAGCLPFVPVESSSAEVVSFNELNFTSKIEASAKIMRLLKNRKRANELRQQLISRSKDFSTEIFVEKLRKITTERLQGKTNAVHTEPRSTTVF